MLKFVAFAILAELGILASDASFLEPAGFRTNGWFQLRLVEHEPARFEIEKSGDLKSWEKVAVLHGSENPETPPLQWVDASTAAPARFYRVQKRDLTFEDDWRNAVFRQDDPFLSEGTGLGLPETRWIKFVITKNEPGRVYYQNSFKYKFHYEFAKLRLQQFAGISPVEFDSVSLRTNGQRAVLGTILIPPDLAMNQVGVQFAGQDAYRPEQIAAWLDVVRTTVLPLDGLGVVYMPSYEQSAAAQENREFFVRRGYEVSSIEAWETADHAYAAGWAIGRVKFIRAADIAKAYADGTLRPDDILLTDAVPAEIPFVAGIMTLSASTPNSHVALLARSYGVPFIFLAGETLRALATDAVGKEIVLSAYSGFPQPQIRILEASNVDPVIRSELAALKAPAVIHITPKAKRGAYISPVDPLTPADFKYFGGKASNFGFLHRQVPDNSPAALAISFDLWDEFMEQKLETGATLGETIRTRLSQHAYPPNVGALASDLKLIRELIEKQTTFTTGQKEAIAQALLGNFDPHKKIRFRSSTNVEDSEEFVGAGLYDSYSGCLEDDLDADTTGRSGCDASEPNERGVFRAIRKVYASFYNDNAVLERMRHGVKEAEVGMAILVHYSNPDEEELANGVATLRFERSGTGASYFGEMVTQKGAVSVTNPDASARPEIVKVSKFFSTPFFSLDQGSTLVPLGGQVLEWSSEYETFTKLFESVASGFGSFYPAKTNYTLDFEYKKIVPNQYLVKQVRELPPPKTAASLPYLLNSGPSDWCVYQGEYGSVFANHRLKAWFSLSTRSLQLTSSNLAETIFGPITVEFANGNSITNLTGLPPEFPGARHTTDFSDPSAARVTDSWELPAANGQRTVHLMTTLRASGGGPEQPPFTSLEDQDLIWEARYAAALPSVEFGEITSVTNESVRLVRCPFTNNASLLVNRSAAAKGVTVEISFFWPKAPSGIAAGYTAPLAGWQETRIAGLTSEPLILHGYYSQTYRPEHHNFSEHFLFEPALEPGISSVQLAELEAKGIRYIYVFWGGLDQASQIYTADAAWTFQPLPVVSDKP